VEWRPAYGIVHTTWRGVVRNALVQRHDVTAVSYVNCVLGGPTNRLIMIVPSGIYKHFVHLYGGADCFRTALLPKAIAPTKQNPSRLRSKPTTLVYIVVTCRLVAMCSLQFAASAREHAAAELGRGGGGCQSDG
jgi:hypothetical protein